MTLHEKLSLPAGPKLDEVIAEDLRGSNPAHGVHYSTSHYGWSFLHDYLRRQGVGYTLYPQTDGTWLADVNCQCPQVASSPLLAAWRAAIQWHHREDNT